MTGSNLSRFRITKAGMDVAGTPEFSAVAMRLAKLL